MIKLLDKNELEGATQGMSPVDVLKFDDKNIPVFVYEASSIIFDLRGITWQYCREAGIIITGYKVAKALDSLYYDAVRYAMKDIQKDLQNIYAGAENELNDVPIGELDDEAAEDPGEELPDDIGVGYFDQEGGDNEA
jgi:hypothetical protein